MRLIIDAHLDIALVAAQRAARFAPGNPRIMETLAELQFHLGHGVEAIDTYLRLVHRPSLPAAQAADLLYRTAILLKKVERDELAWRMLERSLRRDRNGLEKALADKEFASFERNRFKPFIKTP